ncbi:MAG: hypothetical protein JKY55_20330 [Aliivibrio sp.]|uniref:hypothetical protein n=1 Tax=Aliivibrio sp. TaxID=1872443 RepID=UPI001A4015C3|nr:hypothetical protein [Aliivibrio sp.]
MNNVEKVLPEYKPLVYGPFGLLLSKGADIYVSDLALENIRFLSRIEVGWTTKMINSFRLTQRLLRTEIGPAILLECETKILLTAFGSFYLLDVETGEIQNEGNVGRGKRPLMMADVDVEGFNSGVYFGEYIGNPSKEPVSIFHRDQEANWTSVYTFEAGEINHIHAIVPDKINKCLYILTGDFGDGAAIWIARNNFLDIKRLVSRGQQTRACWLMRDHDRLFYATDTQLEINHLNVVKIDKHDHSIEFQSLFPINGSSIYAMQSKSFGMVFSTSVEPSPNPKNFILGLLDRKPAKGIVGNSVCIYSGDLARGFTLLLSAEKDILPARSFQFGAFMFPSGVPGDAGVIHAYGAAVKEYDGCTILIKHNTIFKT